MGDILSGIGSLVGLGAGQANLQNAVGAAQAGVTPWNNLNTQVQMPSNVQADPGTLATQNAILSNIMGKIRSGGLNASDLANLQQIQGATNQMNRQGIQSGLQQARMQNGGGAATGNAGILGAMLGGQQGANEANQQGYQASAQGMQNQNQILGLGGAQAAGLQNQLTGINTGNVERTQAQRQQNEQNAAQQAGGITTAEGNVANAYNKLGANSGNVGAGAGTLAQGIANTDWSKYFGSNGGPTTTGATVSTAVDPSAWAG